MGTDFRGYYASAQIAWEHGVAEVYNPLVQAEYQTRLYQQCPATAFAQQPLVVYMPYLPVFVLFFLPLPLLEFTSSFYAWMALNLVVLVAYLWFFSKSLTKEVNGARLLQWVVCLPVLSNLALGQMNVFLVICLGQFLLAFLKDQPLRSGAWLGGMLLKPHTLILLLPGLVLSRNWRTLLGFVTSGILLLGLSLLMGGIGGLLASIQLALQFAGPLIQTGASMMNWRALALNLQGVFPTGLAWTLAICGMIATALCVFYFWLRKSAPTKTGLVYLILITYLGTCVLTWHSHFYLLMPLIPIFIYLDHRGVLPVSIRAAWIFTPPLLYITVYLVNPSLARNWFGLELLVFDLALLAWTAARLIKVDRS